MKGEGRWVRSENNSGNLQQPLFFCFGKQASPDKETILGVECTRYDYDFVVKADYWVDEATKIVYKFVNYLDKNKESKNATFEIKSWETSVKAFEWDKPE